MAKRVTQTDIEEFNKLYLTLKTYAAVARQTGFSAGTVKRYIIPGFTVSNGIEPLSEDRLESIERFIYEFASLEDFGEMAVLSQNERVEIYELWKELSI